MGVSTSWSKTIVDLIPCDRLICELHGEQYDMIVAGKTRCRYSMMRDQDGSAGLSPAERDGYCTEGFSGGSLAL